MMVWPFEPQEIRPCLSTVQDPTLVCFAELFKKRAWRVRLAEGGGGFFAR
jgi:hypothetical protein